MGLVSQTDKQQYLFDRITSLEQQLRNERARNQQNIDQYYQQQMSGLRGYANQLPGAQQLVPQGYGEMSATVIPTPPRVPSPPKANKKLLEWLKTNLNG